MKAAQFYDRKGGPEVLRYGELPDRVPGPGELRVRGCVSAIDPSDTKTIQGWRWRASMSFPRVVLRNDGTGKVEMAGPGVPEATVGERVWVYEAQRDGRAFCTVVEYVVPSANAVTLPDDVPLDRVTEAHPLLRTAGVSDKILVDIA